MKEPTEVIRGSVGTLGFGGGIGVDGLEMVDVGDLKTIVILGPTASGKTGVAVRTAQELVATGVVSGVEIISADSRAIYKGMDIGTAKPSLEERGGVPHWGLDLVEPGERFTVADFKEYAEKKIEEIQGRGHLAMVVGGTGLYIDALVYDYQFGEEAGASQKDREKVCTNYLLIGVKSDPKVLRERIEERVNKLFVQELYDETRELVEKYGWGSQAMKSDIYQFAWGYMTGQYRLEEAKKLCSLDDWHLAKRQMTWFRRNKEINWVELAEIPEFVRKNIEGEQ